MGRQGPLKLRLAGCSIFKVFVNGEFAAYGPARGPHGWFRMDEWDLSRVARKGGNRLSIVGVAYNTTTYYIVEHEPFLQVEVLADGKVVRATGDGKWDANFTERVRKAQRYSLQRAQSEVYEVPRHDHWEWWKRDGFKSKSLIITNCPAVMWDVKEPGEYDFESFEPYTFKFAEVIMLEGEATVEKLEMRTYRNPNATRACTLEDPADRTIFEAARATFAQNAVDVFTDCPSRERAGWLCDSYFTGPAEHFFTGRNEIERTFLRNFALAEAFPHLPEGMVPMCYPDGRPRGG